MVQVDASATGYATANANLEVEDHETLAIYLDRPLVVENAGNNAAFLTIKRSNVDDQSPLTVSLVLDDTSELAIAESVEFAADESEIQVTIQAVDDNLRDGTQFVQILVQHPAFESDDASLGVADHETVTLLLSKLSLIHI